VSDSSLVASGGAEQPARQRVATVFIVNGVAYPNLLFGDCRMLPALSLPVRSDPVVVFLDLGVVLIVRVPADSQMEDENCVQHLSGLLWRGPGKRVPVPAHRAQENSRDAGFPCHRSDIDGDRLPDLDLVAAHPNLREVVAID